MPRLQWRRLEAVVPLNMTNQKAALVIVGLCVACGGGKAESAVSSPDASADGGDNPVALPTDLAPSETAHDADHTANPAPPATDESDTDADESTPAPSHGSSDSTQSEGQEPSSTDGANSDASGGAPEQPSDTAPAPDVSDASDAPDAPDTPGVPDTPAAPEARCAVPPEGQPIDTSAADQVIGGGTPESCTADAVIEAVARGGVIVFDCGPNPVTITLDRPAKVFNDKGPEIVLDGGGLVTLSGGGSTRILYMNTCDEAQGWTTAHCQDQDHPRLTVQNLTFIDGNSKAEGEYDGGGAIWVRGGRFKVINSRFYNNVCADSGPDVGGGAIRAFSQYQGQPVYVVGSTFGGANDRGNSCSNGGAVSSIDVSWNIINSEFSYNRAVGNGGNPAQAGTPGGGSGGAIYNDGNTMRLSLCGADIHHNEVNAFGSAIFFVSNDHSGDVHIDTSVITANSGGSWYPAYPQISHHDDTPIQVRDSRIE